MSRIVVIDASPLIGLAMVDGLKWLPDIFGTVFLPETVKQEVLPGKAARGEEAIAYAINAGWLAVWPEPIEPRLDIDLDAGETDCINLGLSHADEVLLIMDVRAGRSCCSERERTTCDRYCGDYWSGEKTRVDCISKSDF